MRALALWVAIVALLFGIAEWRGLEGARGSFSNLEWRDFRWAAVTLVAGAAFVAMHFWRRRRLAQLVERARTELAEHRYSQVLVTALELKPFASNWSAILEADANLFLWRIDAAHAAYDRVESMNRRTPALRNEVIDRIVLCLVFKNDLQRAASVLEANPSAEPESKSRSLARGLLALRSDRAEEATRFFERERHAAEQPLGALTAAADAFAAERLGLRVPKIDAVALFRETGPSVMARYWPELSAFVERSAKA